MTLNVTNVGDNPQIPGVAAEAYIPDQLIAGQFNLVTDTISLAAGVLLRGTVLGQKTIGTASSAVKAGGNTGNGTLTPDVTTPVLVGAKPGVYQVRLITAAANAGTFRVTDPDGQVLGDVGVGATFADQIKFATADGATDFIVGDGFDVTVAGGDGSWLKSVKTAVDGTAVPKAILVDNADASGGAVRAGAYITGEFNETAIIYDGTWTLAELKVLLRPYSIFLKPVVSATDPT